VEEKEGEEEARRDDQRWEVGKGCGEMHKGDARRGSASRGAERVGDKEARNVRDKGCKHFKWAWQVRALAMLASTSSPGRCAQGNKARPMQRLRRSRQRRLWRTAHASNQARGMRTRRGTHRGSARGSAGSPPADSRSPPVHTRHVSLGALALLPSPPHPRTPRGSPHAVGSICLDPLPVFY